MKYSLVVLGLLAMLGCSENPPEKKIDPRIKKVVFLNVEDGKQPTGALDLRLSVIDTTQSPFATNYNVLALNGDQMVGLMISIPKDTGTSPFADGFTLKSVGEPSNHLLELLSYPDVHQPGDSVLFVGEITARYVDIRKMAKQYKEGEVEKLGGDYKLFFDINGGEEPAELYINVDPAANWIEIKEKHPDFHSGIIKALSGRSLIGPGIHGS